MSLNNFTSLDPVEVDVWEVDRFDEDCEGQKLAKIRLGVRVNGGTWLGVTELFEYIDQRIGELRGTR